MTPATKKLNELLIRHAKGIIAAWESWLVESASSLNSSGSPHGLAQKSAPRLHDASRETHSEENTCNKRRTASSL